MKATSAVSTRPNTKRRWFQFRLRTLLLVTAGCAVVLALWTAYVSPYRAQQRAIAAITESGGTVATEPIGPEWLRTLIGDGYFVKVTNAWLWGFATDSDLEDLASLNNVQAIGLSHSKITDAGLEHLKGLTKLRHLYLARTQVSDAGLEHLKGITSLTGLLLGGTQISDAGLEHLKGLTNLRSLDLSNTRISDAGLEHLTELTNLEKLYLANTQVSDAGLEHLKQIPNLRGVHLAHTQVSAAGVLEIQAALIKRDLPISR